MRMIHTLTADARDLPLKESAVDLIVTSPPYWRKRDYGMAGQIGQESTPGEYVQAIRDALREWMRVLRPTGSIFLNVGDTYRRQSLAGIPGLIEAAATQDGWLLRNRIIWAKKQGVPSPVKNRLVSRHEYILHLTRSKSYFYDLQAYAEYKDRTGNPGDVWHIKLKPSRSSHLAPFPPELVRRAVLLGCPGEVCSECQKPRERILERTRELNARRPQARRAMEIADEAGLTDEHIAAIQATGISDAGKAMKTQNGTGRNAEQVQILAAEAKEVLGGYFREFTFAKKRTAGFTNCGCGVPFQPGVVLDPFSGSGTSLIVASGMGRRAIGADLSPTIKQQRQLELTSAGY